MSFPIRRSLVMSVTAFAMLSAPVLLDNTGLPFDAGIDAVAAGKGKGGGKGGGNSGGGGGGNSSKSSSASSSGNGASKGKKADTGTVQTASVKGSGSKRSLNADLGRLNSLKRNINGLMNSNDPKMAGVRAYVIANGTLVDAQAALATAATTLSTAQSAYITLANSLGVGAYEDITPTGLQTELGLVNAALVGTPDDLVLLEQQALLTTAISTIETSAELADLVSASQGLVAAQGDVATAELAVSEDALREALHIAANPNRRSEDYLTPEIMAWASNELGVGDANGLIDAYLASR